MQQNAVGHAFRCPSVGGSARHVDDRKCRIDLPDQARNLPTLHRPLEVTSVTSAEYLTTPLSIIATASWPEATVVKSKPPSFKAS